MNNFKVIEDTRPRWESGYTRFVEMYNSPGVFKKHILQELGWSENQYRQAREQAIQDKLIPEIRRPKKFKYYYPTPNGKYIVDRRSKKCFVHVTVENKEEAEKLVEYLHLTGWSMDNVEEWRKGEM